MNRRPQVTVRRLMKWVVVAAVVLAVGRYPYRFVREQQRFAARSRQGMALVQSFRAHCPTGVSPASWDEAVGVVQTAWANVVFSPEHIDDADLDVILARMHGMAARATPAEAEGDLYWILDLLAHARTRASVNYLCNMRNWVKRATPGEGRPSPGLAGYALAQLGPRAGDAAVASIIAGLRAGDWQVRVACCRALGQYGLGLGSPADAEGALDGLIGALDDDDPLIREIAVECLHEMGTKAGRAAVALSGELKHDPSLRVRWQAARALGVVGKGQTAAIRPLIEAIDDEEPIVGETALSSLAGLGKEAGDAIPAILKALRNRDDRIREAAISAIARVSPPADVGIPSLLGVLKNDPSGSVRSRAVEALAGLGADASTAVPALIESLQRDDDPDVRNHSLRALALIAPTDPRTAATLARTLKGDAAAYVRATAAEALGQIGPPAAAVPTLTDSLKDPEVVVRMAAAEALKKVRGRP